MDYDPQIGEGIVAAELGRLDQPVCGHCGGER
jgi:hypothetical protein